MNGNSFQGLEAYEQMPLSKWHLLLEIHNEAVEEHNEAIKEASRE